MYENYIEIWKYSPEGKLDAFSASLVEIRTVFGP